MNLFAGQTVLIKERGRLVRAYEDNEYPGIPFRYIDYAGMKTKIRRVHPDGYIDLEITDNVWWWNPEWVLVPIQRSE